MIRLHLNLLVFVVTLAEAPRLVAQPEQPQPAPKSGSAVTTALWFAHHYAAPQALAPGKDRPLKIKLTTALGKSAELPWNAISDDFDKDSFWALAGDGTAITVAKMEQLIRDKTPQSRKDLNAKTRLHADLLTTQFDLIEEPHRKAAEELVEWLVKNYKA